jgi:hypothetical protein
MNVTSVMFAEKSASEMKIAPPQPSLEGACRSTNTRWEATKQPVVLVNLTRFRPVNGLEQDGAKVNGSKNENNILNDTSGEKTNL